MLWALSLGTGEGAGTEEGGQEGSLCIAQLTLTVPQTQ